MDDPTHLTEPTISSYAERAQEFWEGTRDHDVSQNIEALLGALEGSTPLTILDLGCGPGRDLADLRNRGHHPIGLDGCEEFCAMARSHSQCTVWHQNFLSMQLPEELFDGVFANATLFHVPSAHLPRVLSELYASLKPSGVLFSSNPRGPDEEGWNGDRYACFHSLSTWTSYLTGAGFESIRHYYRPPGLPRDQQPWLASLWRKP
ncbi:MAG: class I SAM-dependent methyltransferase [Myxococcota bacterium]|nr:class I SAM-dependent methyltransferase [Myxococcota bacterium]